jgi:hypothetical protein
MNKGWLLAIIATFTLFYLPQAANAFDCPNRFQSAQAAIDKVLGDMKGDMSKMMSKADMAQVHMLLDDAKMWLAGAKHNHEKPQGRMDHARAMAKAAAARGHAEAADTLHFKMMKK